MGYLSIKNLYRPEAQDILLFKTCFALEKVHGTSAHISWKDGILLYFSGGEKRERFVGLFNEADLIARFTELGHDNVVVFGEAYGGKQQGMSGTYGPDLHFIVFEVKVGDVWLSVPNAEDVAEKLGLEFVPWMLIPAELSYIDAERDKPSLVAGRRGIQEPKMREGVVLRPPVEFIKPNGERVIAKHKRDEFKETATAREVSPEQLKVLRDAEAVAAEWATPMRLEHVLGKQAEWTWPQDAAKAIKALVEDVKIESAGEVVWGKDVEKALGKAASRLLKVKGCI